VREKDSFITAVGVVIALGVIAYLLMVSITAGSLSLPSRGILADEPRPGTDGLIYSEDYDEGLSGWTLIRLL
jgi:hypothetical protein